MKKEYTAKPEMVILCFDAADLCATSEDEPEKPWGNDRYDFPMMPV